MSWLKPKASQEEFDYLVKMVQTQKAEIIRLEGKVKALDTALSRIRIKATEPESLNKTLIGSNVKRQAEGFNRPREVFQGHSNATPHYSDSSPDLSTVMLVSAVASDSSSSCGGE